MVIDVTKHNASILTAGENTIACSNITEAFLDVFSVDYGKDFAIIKQAHRYINNNPVVKVDVVANEHLYKDVEFILVKSDKQGIFINENSLANGIIIEQREIEVAPEETSAAEHCAHEIDATLDSVVVEEVVAEIDVADLKQQAKAQQQSKVLQQLQMIQEELSDQVQFEMQQTKQSLFTETLAIQDKIQTDNAQMVQQSIEAFRVQLKQWAMDAQQHLAEYAEEAIADAELQLMENSKQLLQHNKQQTFDELQREISVATINSMAAIKETLNAEIAAQLKTFDEHHQQKDDAIELFVQEQMHQLHMQIESAQMQSFDAKVAELLMKQHEWLKQNINETTDAYDAKLDAMHQQLNKVVAETSADVASCIKSADATIETKIAAALQQLNEKASQLHQERVQTIEQSVAQVLKDNISDEQTDVVSEARSSARNAVRDALAAYKTDVSKDLNAQLMNIQKELHAKMQMYVQSYGGGGSVAMQFADGGTMNGTLNVSNGQILSAGVDLATIFAGGGSIVSGDYLPLSGGNLTGSLTINGTLSSSQLMYDATGNSSQWNGVFTTVNANSASWSESPYLSALNDVFIPAPVNGQVLTYNSITNKWNAGTPLSAAGATGYYGSFYDERNQSATSPTSSYVVAMSGTFESNGISLSSNGIVFQYDGTYEIIYSLQIVSSHNAQEDIQVWFNKNGVDVPNSNSVFTVAAKAGNVTGKIVMVTPFIITVNGGDVVKLKWNAADTGIQIDSLPPNTTPTTPAAPGVIVTAKQVTNVQLVPTVGAYLPLSGGALTGAVSTTNVIYTTGGNSDQWNSSYSNVNSNSAYWQNTYTSFSTQSASNASVYSSVQANSASWNNTTAVEDANTIIGLSVFL